MFNFLKKIYHNNKMSKNKKPKPKPIPEPIPKPVPEPELVPGPYTYAPRRKVVKGEPTLSVLGMTWNNQGRAVSASDCKKLANDIRKFYLRNSRNLLNFKIKAATDVKVPLNAAKKNLNKAEQYCMKKFPNSDYYALINNGVKGYSNSGKSIAHLLGALSSTGCHEIGHCLNLGHASNYYINSKGKLDLSQTGDRQSVMGRFSSALITAPQYYHMGWLFENECAMHEYDGPEKLYELRPIGKTDKTDVLAAVRIVLPNNVRDAFVSFPSKCHNSDSCIALHLTNGGGSQLIQIFGNEFYDERFTGLLIKKVGYKDGLITISIKKVGTLGSDIDTPFEEEDPELEMLEMFSNPDTLCDDCREDDDYDESLDNLDNKGEDVVCESEDSE